MAEERIIHLTKENAHKLIDVDKVLALIDYRQSIDEIIDMLVTKRDKIQGLALVICEDASPDEDQNYWLFSTDFTNPAEINWLLDKGKAILMTNQAPEGSLQEN